MRLVLSPVGTSILTNQAGEKRSILNQYANASEQHTPPKIKELIIQLQQETDAAMQDATPAQLRRSSAELNGIIGLYGGELPKASDDMHYLIATDTAQGQTTSNMVKGLLEKNFPNTQIYTPSGLKTENKASFEQGIKELLNWCDETLPGFRNSGTEIIFNLTGGFKSLQGYLNTIGMFYADRIIYIFETGHEVINIPRLPVHLKKELFERHASLFLQLSQASDGIFCDQLADIPEVMLDRIEDRCLLSTWGTLVWNNSKEDILSKRLIDLPMIAYEESFKRDFERHGQVQEKIKLQETVAKVACLLQENNGDPGCLRAGRGGGILYDNYSGKNSHLGHFRLSKGPRVSCEYKKRCSAFGILVAMIM
jgi:putative CRISPR-associated protein (TIGR02619 family)